MAERTLEAVVGGNLRRLREASGLRQEDLAARMRAVGLSWTQATVAAVETGRRALSIGELLFLEGLVPEKGKGGQKRKRPLLVELLRLEPPDEVVRVEGEYVRRRVGARVERVVDNGVLLNRDQWGKLQEGRVFVVTDRERLRRELGPQVERRQKQWAELARWYDVYPDDVWDAYVIARDDDAAGRAAERLGRDALLVGLACLKLWGRGLTEERERVLRQSGGQGDERVRRGHITTRLTQELAEVIRKAEGRRRK